MKLNKIFAILSAARLGCCALGGTAFAEEAEPVDYSKYQLGDINLDGEVAIDDAQLALQCYADALANRPFVNIPYDQQLLACAKGFVVSTHVVYPQEDRTVETTRVITIEEAQDILNYYCECVLAKKSDLSYEEWIAAQEDQQAIFSAMYNEYVNNPEYTAYGTDFETGERYVWYHSTTAVLRVRG